MATNKISDQLSNLQIDKDQDINILLLGESGVGKSTFINSLANYILFKNYKRAAKNKLFILIPAQFTVTNVHGQQVFINVGASDDNEYQEFGAAATQKVKTYVFPIGEGKTRLRLIDTPGMGDPRGIQQDDINCENILSYLAQLKELHAICFLMKPTTTRLTVFFEYCVKQILSRLEKSASKNIIFVFTNTRGSNYSAGDTLNCLRKVTEAIKSQPPHVDIPLEANVFCVDNEAFRYLAASQQNVEFDDNIRDRYVESWKKSAQQCLNMISYIIGDVSNDPLKPHQLMNTVSINEARRIIEHLSQPLAEISQLIFDNLRILERHQRNLQIENQSLDQLKKNLYIPILDLEATQLTQPVTVCTSSKCVTILKVQDLTKKHYGQRCHDPCYLTNVQREIVGDPALQFCAAMAGTRLCQKCTCDYTVHQHIYYMTKTVDRKIEDTIVKSNIHQKEAALAEVRRIMGEIDKRKSALEAERETIIKSTAQFAHFLQQNAISPFNDSYKSYIQYLIKREESLGKHGDQEVVNNLQQLVKRYDEIKTAFDKTLEYNKSTSMGLPLSDSPDFILATIQNLYKLPLNGKKINELLKKQKASRKFEYDKNCEYIHPKTAELKEKSKKKEEKKKEKKQKSNQKEEQTKIQHSREFVQSKPPRERPPPYEAINRSQPPRQYHQRFKQDDSSLRVEVKVTNNTKGQQKYSKNPNFHGSQPSHVRNPKSNLQAMQQYKSRECNCPDCLQGTTMGQGAHAVYPNHVPQQQFQGHPHHQYSNNAPVSGPLHPGNNSSPHANFGPLYNPNQSPTQRNYNVQQQNPIPPLLSSAPYNALYNQNMGSYTSNHNQHYNRQFSHGDQYNSQNLSNYVPSEDIHCDHHYGHGTYDRQDDYSRNPNMQRPSSGNSYSRKPSYYSDAGYGSHNADPGNEFQRPTRQGYSSDSGRGRGGRRGKSLGRQPKKNNNKSSANNSNKKQKSQSSDSSSSSNDSE